jgi:hypothetical protein
MDPITQQAVLATAGAAGGGDKVYVDDVFSTYLYEGTDITNQIINDIDLAGEGGLVWIKPRATTYGHTLYDTGRGAAHYMGSDSNAASYDLSTYFSGYGLTSFNNNGFTLGSNWTGENATNAGGIVSWSFRKAPGFFDVVTYTGSGTAGKTVAHSLGSVPGMIMVKCTNTANTNWLVYHRSLGATKAVLLDLTNAAIGPSANYWNNTAPTSTQFTLGSSNDVNTNGDTYVAYIFAHDDQSFGTGGNESIIKCGSYTGNGSIAGPVIDVGFEPQWLMVKNTTTAAYDWAMYDSMRGLAVDESMLLVANAYAAEQQTSHLKPTPTGFQLTSQGYICNQSGANYIYIAIRHPNKPPTAGTEVFAANTQTGRSGNQGAFRSGFVVDMAIKRGSINGTSNNDLCSRMLPGKYLTTNSNVVAQNDLDNKFYYMDGWNKETANATYKFSWMFKRAPGFFDVATYDGNGLAGKSVNHNLKAVPEFIICKSFADGGGAGWWCYHKDLSTNYAIRMDGASNGSVAEQSASNYWNSSTHSATTFTLGNYGDINGSGKTFISYLFATLPGISKVGSYTGNSNSSVTVDCGFSGGPRFLLIKSIDSTGNWHIWDSTRGINSGTNSYDPYFLLNTNAAQASAGDYIDPTTSGFTVKPAATAAGLNTQGGTYLFLAIA